jgi:hypothetical protein
MSTRLASALILAIKLYNALIFLAITLGILVVGQRLFNLAIFRKEMSAEFESTLDLHVIR